MRNLLKPLYAGLVLLFFSLLACSHSPVKTSSSCESLRGAIDMGSGSLKALGAKVNHCDQKIIAVIFKDQRPLPFKEALDRSKNKTIDAKTISLAEKEFLSLVQEMKDTGISNIQAVATSALRQAKNGKDIAQHISKVSLVPVRVISQKDEAMIGYTSAFVKAPEAIQPEEAVVWDIGGGSMQITYKDEDKIEVFQGKMASLGFKNLVLKKLFHQNPKSRPSPNPLQKKQSDAVILAEKNARKTLPKEFRKLAKDKQWYGIGGVWWHSVRGQLKKPSSISSDQIEKALVERSELNDSEIGGDFAPTEVTNLALTLGFMKALGLQKITPIDASLTEGLLFYKF
ncbi:MAG TPA: hypothetical protein DCL41_00140 [Bdellovibrionales bacterium]|nr:hypothetical protein [Bdellovibrionales bacterium]